MVKMVNVDEMQHTEKHATTLQCLRIGTVKVELYDRLEHILTVRDKEGNLKRFYDVQRDVYYDFKFRCHCHLELTTDDYYRDFIENDYISDQ